MRGVVLAVLLVVSPAVAVAAGADDEAVRAAVRQSLDRSVQTRLPGEEQPTAGKASSTWRRRQTGGDTPRVPARRIEPADAGWSGGGAASTVASVLMWTVVAVGAGLLLAYAARELSGAGGTAPRPEAAAPPTRDDQLAVVEQPLADADELAREGRFAEAIHTLLLRTLRELAARSRAALPRSLTSREILARVDLGADARLALGDLVTTTERSHFGDDEPGAADYDRCRRQFHVFAAAYRGEAAA
jgi:hypothetical protein